MARKRNRKQILKYAKQTLKHTRYTWKQILGNRKVKDRLFCYIFERDKKALLQLYNALNGTNYQDEQALRIVTLQNVVYMSMHNDVAFILAGTLNLYEHQSTICPNLPLRFLLYLAAEIEALIALTDENIYGGKQIKLPAPRCVVFYNGETSAPEEQYLYLTDAFTDELGRKQESGLELKVKVLNINQISLLIWQLSIVLHRECWQTFWVHFVRR